MSDILIFRLTTNELIVGEAKLLEKNKGYLIKNPLDIFFKRYPDGNAGISLYPWLPREIILNDTVVIEHNQICYVNTPSLLFIEMYNKVCLYLQKRYYDVQESVDYQLNKIIDGYDRLLKKDESEEIKANEYTDEDYEKEYEEILEYLKDVKKSVKKNIH